MLAERSACLRPCTQDKVRDPVGQAGFLQDPHEQNGRTGCQLAGLDDEGVAGRQCRTDLPRRLQQRVVPGRDQTAHADRLVVDPRQGAGRAGLDDSPREALRHPREVAEAAHHVGDVVARLDDPLAGVEGLRSRDDLDIALKEVGDAIQEG